MHSQTNQRKQPDRLDRMQVQTPCEMDWELMAGDKKVRYCDLCQRNVYNLVQLTRVEIDKIWETEPERVCARIMKDDAGRLVTRETDATAAKTKSYQFSTFFLLALMTSCAPLAAVSPALYRSARTYFNSWFEEPKTSNPVMGKMIMGDVYVAPISNPNSPESN